MNEEERWPQKRYPQDEGAGCDCGTVRDSSAGTIRGQPLNREAAIGDRKYGKDAATNGNVYQEVDCEYRGQSPASRRQKFNVSAAHYAK